MLTEGSKDFLKPFLTIGFNDVITVKDELYHRFIPRYMPVFEKVFAHRN